MDGPVKPGHDGFRVVESYCQHSKDRLDSYKINLLKSAFFARSPTCLRT
jgi:hypothetical protein